MFVDECFWHSCPDHATIPKTNKTWWIGKLKANVGRERRHTEELHPTGWEVLRFWEHNDMSEAAAEVEGSVLARR